MKTSRFKDHKDWAAWFEKQPQDFKDKWEEMNDKFGDVVKDKHNKEAMTEKFADLLIDLDSEDVEEDVIVSELAEIGLELITTEHNDDGSIDFLEFEYRDEIGLVATVDICFPESSSCEHDYENFHLQIDVSSEVEEEFEGLRESLDSLQISDEFPDEISLVEVVKEVFSTLDETIFESEF